MVSAKFTSTTHPPTPTHTHTHTHTIYRMTNNNIMSHRQVYFHTQFYFYCYISSLITLSNFCILICCIFSQGSVQMCLLLLYNVPLIRGPQTVIKRLDYWYYLGPDWYWLGIGANSDLDQAAANVSVGVHRLIKNTNIKRD